MSKSRAYGSLVRLTAGLLLGVVATFLGAFMPLFMIERGHGAKIDSIHRGLYGWWHATDHAFGLDWSNLQLMDPPLSTPITDGELAPWEEPPPPPYPAAQFLRIGTLTAGWPLRVVTYRWTVTSTTQNFPVPAELDDGDTSIVYAAESVLMGTRGGGPQQRQILWLGVVIDVVLYGAVVVGPIALARRFARGELRRHAGQVTPPAAAAERG